MKKLNVLVAPLDWGLGHATRCIPIIQLLLKKGFDVHLGSNGNALKLLRDEFPHLPYLKLPSYNARYYGWLPFMIGIFIQLPKFLFAIGKEKNELRKYALEFKIDLIIADNRYGCRINNIHSVFIGHQMNIIMPSYLKFMEPVVNFFNWKFIEAFDECWIPDEVECAFSGKLSLPYPANSKKIGLLSRFSPSAEVEKEFELAVVLSGPEPQRTKLEELILKELEHTKLKTILIRGLPGEAFAVQTPSYVQVVDYLNANQLQQVIKKSTLVMCRSGYSSIMDLAVLGKRVIFVPTPGQTEQEYLAKMLQEKKIACFQNQSKLNLSEALIREKEFTGFSVYSKNYNVLENAIEALIT